MSCIRVRQKPGKQVGKFVMYEVTVRKARPDRDANHYRKGAWVAPERAKKLRCAPYGGPGEGIPVQYYWQ